MPDASPFRAIFQICAPRADEAATLPLPPLFTFQNNRVYATLIFIFAMFYDAAPALILLIFSIFCLFSPSLSSMFI